MSRISGRPGAEKPSSRNVALGDGQQGPHSENPASQDLANQGKKLFAALALMVRLPNV